MKTIKLTPLVILIVSITGTFCKKGTESKSKTQLLTQSTWSPTGLLSKLPGDADWIDESETIALCAKDNIVTYRTDGSVENNEGASKCQETDPQVRTDNWEFAENGAKLKIDATIYGIIELSEQRLILQYSIAVGQDQEYLYRFIYSH